MQLGVLLLLLDEGLNVVDDVEVVDVLQGTDAVSQTAVPLYGGLGQTQLPEQELVSIVQLAPFHCRKQYEQGDGVVELELVVVVV